MSDDKRNDYSDFFNPKREDDRQDKAMDEQPKADSYYYYTYESDARPRSVIQDDGQQELQREPEQQPAGADGDVHVIESAAPFAPVQQEPKPKGVWAYPQKPKGTFRRVFASFLAGAVVMGGLMFGADRADLFTSGGSTTAAGTESGSGVNVSSGDGGAGVTTAAMEVVRPGDIAEMVEQTSPAVVKIETYRKASSMRGGSLFGDSFFDQFFSDPFSDRQRQESGNDELIQSGMGTGFFFDQEGYILTNQHVVEDADQIKVIVEGYDEPLEAELLGSSFDLDLAVVKVKGSGNFKTLPLGDDENTAVGDWVVAIGNPYGFDHTVTVGVLSAKERPIQIADGTQTRNYKNLLQTDASINPGNSGGPLLNLNGEVIGINTAVSSQAQGIGFAIPTSTVKSVLEMLKNDESIPKPYIGIYMANIEEGWLNDLKLDSTDGVLVQSIVQNSPAEKAGLQPYDVIVKFNDTELKNYEQLSDLISKTKIGDRVTLTIVRDGQTLTTAVIVGDQNQQ